VTLYIYELNDGRVALGFHVAPPRCAFDPDISRARARRRAIEQVERLRGWMGRPVTGAAR
jgi:hypothetical protein